MLRDKVRTAGQILLIPVEDILPPVYNNRIIVSEEEINRLAESIREIGLITPITVSSCDSGLYRVISGERRRRAAIISGMKCIPCLLMRTDYDNSLILNLISDIHKKELHFLEIAEAIENLRGTMSVSEISRRLSVPEGMILSRIRLLNLPESIKYKIISNNINEQTANSIANIRDIGRQNEIVELIINKSVSFNEAYELTETENKRNVFIAHYKDYTIFENTIEHAVKTMKASGIIAEMRKNDNNEITEYVISINKMV